MPSNQEKQLRQQTAESLARLQSFDTSLLPREKELGSVVNFSESVQPAERLIALYKRVSQTILDDLPESHLNAIVSQANSDYNILKQILEFQPGKPVTERDSLIIKLDQAYQPCFNALQSFISFSASKSTDFQGLERQARATIQTVSDMGNKLSDELRTKSQEAERVLELVRRAAAEHGVSQQAIYFRDDAKEHEDNAILSRKDIRNSAIILGVYAVFTLFLHKIPVIKPEDVYQTAQLAISKVLIFGVLSYMVYLATKNFMAHKHNAVINRHRQNALMTYKALVEAAKEVANKEVILTHASACIFAPQPTGYSAGASSDGPAAKSVVELLTNTISGEK
ncbi:MAG TPA: hypothetical protein PKE26_07360 [Kiritimatiellia bacterium]|nr:hypothetical protein [Kiritimatiellia bacterium]HMO98909.1 hypothetical protein [Kiritimatiellia bacterium]